LPEPAVVAREVTAGDESSEEGDDWSDLYPGVPTVELARRTEARVEALAARWLAEVERWPNADDDEEPAEEDADTEEPASERLARQLTRACAEPCQGEFSATSVTDDDVLSFVQLGRLEAEDADVRAPTLARAMLVGPDFEVDLGAIGLAEATRFDPETWSGASASSLEPWSGRTRRVLVVSDSSGESAPPSVLVTLRQGSAPTLEPACRVPTDTQSACGTLVHCGLELLGVPAECEPARVFVALVREQEEARRQTAISPQSARPEPLSHAPPRPSRLAALRRLEAYVAGPELDTGAASVFSDFVALSPTERQAQVRQAWQRARFLAASPTSTSFAVWLPDLSLLIRVTPAQVRPLYCRGEQCTVERLVLDFDHDGRPEWVIVETMSDPGTDYLLQSQPFVLDEDGTERGIPGDFLEATFSVGTNAAGLDVLVVDGVALDPVDTVGLETRALQLLHGVPTSCAEDPNCAALRATLLRRGANASRVDAALAPFVRE
jgi:hypothetical protein